MNQEIEKTLNYADKSLRQVIEYFKNWEGLSVEEIAILTLNVQEAIHKIECLRLLELSRKES